MTVAVFANERQKRVMPASRVGHRLGGPLPEPGADGARRNLEQGAGRAFALSIVARIEAIVREETLALASAATFDLERFNNHKSQSLVDLNHAIRNLAPHDMDADFRNRLTALRARLSENLAMISMHLQAVREISSLLSQSMQNADLDGTYSPRITSARRAP